MRARARSKIRHEHALLILSTICALSFVTSVGPATAQTNVGWVWSNQLSPTSCYSPPTPWSYNSRGGGVGVCWGGPLNNGTYNVDFPYLYSGQPDNVQVTAYEDYRIPHATHSCSITKWGPMYGSYVHAQVDCLVNLFGAFRPAASYFTLLYQARSGGFGSSSNGIAFLYADQPTAASYTPALAQQYNSSGGTNTIVRNGTGNYTVTIPGLQSNFSNVQVTYSGGRYGGLGHCNTISWVPHTGGGTDVRVQCYTGGGTPGDSNFSLAYAVNAPFGVTTPSHSQGAWAWANDAGSTVRYIPGAFYQYNGFQTGYLTAQKLKRGIYAVYVPGSLAYDRSNVLVTAYGDTGDFCNIGEWETATIYVYCSTQRGDPADTQFDVSFQTSRYFFPWPPFLKDLFGGGDRQINYRLPGQ